MRDVSEGWRTDRLWAPVYAFGLNRPWLARLGGLAIQTDLGLLYDAIEVVAAAPAGSRILDVPCGGGVALRGLTPGQEVRYVAVDIAPAMVARTRAEAARRGVADRVEVREGDLMDLDFEAGSFALCVSFTGLHCVPDPRRGLSELARVLAPGGTLAGSLLVSDTVWHRRPIQIGGRLAGLIGPSASEAQMRRWLGELGIVDAGYRRSGDLLYFRGRRGA